MTTARNTEIDRMALAHACIMPPFLGEKPKRTTTTTTTTWRWRGWRQRARSRARLHARSPAGCEQEAEEEEDAGCRRRRAKVMGISFAFAALCISSSFLSLQRAFFQERASPTTLSHRPHSTLSRSAESVLLRRCITIVHAKGRVVLRMILFFLQVSSAKECSYVRD